MDMKNEIKQGSFIRLEPHWGDWHWCEVILINKPLMSTLRKPEQTYSVRSWAKGEWVDYTFAPDTAHKNMYTQVLNLDPAVADIFRQTTMKER